MEKQYITHPIPPFYNSDSEILILGSFPSVKSREEGFFYGNPLNRFWKVLAYLYGVSVPIDIENKKSFLSENKIALYDVVFSCEISGSSDSSIKNVRAADISGILKGSAIKKIILNGKTAERLYYKYVYPIIGIKGETAPSTSTANAAYSLSELTIKWQAILNVKKI